MISYFRITSVLDVGEKTYWEFPRSSPEKANTDTPSWEENNNTTMYTQVMPMQHHPSKYVRCDTATPPYQYVCQQQYSPNVWQPGQCTIILCSNLMLGFRGALETA